MWKYSRRPHRKEPVVTYCVSTIPHRPRPPNLLQKLADSSQTLILRGTTFFLLKIPARTKETGSRSLGSLSPLFAIRSCLPIDASLEVRVVQLVRGHRQVEIGAVRATAIVRPHRERRAAIGGPPVLANQATQVAQTLTAAE